MRNDRSQQYHSPTPADVLQLEMTVFQLTLKVLKKALYQSKGTYLAVTCVMSLGCRMRQVVKVKVEKVEL